MAIVYGKHKPTYQWYQNTYESWTYDIPIQHYFTNDTLRVAYSSMYDAWVIFINHHAMGQAPTLDEAKDLAVLLYKLHPDTHYSDDDDPRMPKFL